MDHRAGLGNIVDHAGDQGRGLAALHLPHGQMENLVPQQLPGPEGDLLDAVLAADIAPHGNGGIEDGQQGIADDNAVVKLALIDLDHILRNRQENLGIDKAEHQGGDKKPPGNGEAGIKCDIGAEGEFFLLLLPVLTVLHHISAPPLHFPSFPDSKSRKPGLHPAPRRTAPCRPGGRSDSPRCVWSGRHGPHRPRSFPP